MALLDVTEVLLDPDFMDTSLSVLRIAQSVGNDGNSVNTPSTSPFAGVITSNTGEILYRLPEGERLADNIMIHTIFRLQDGQSGFTADIINWQGRQWTVSNVNDYSHFGRGFVAALCDLIPVAG